MIEISAYRKYDNMWIKLVFEEKIEDWLRMSELCKIDLFWDNFFWKLKIFVENRIDTRESM